MRTIYNAIHGIQARGGSSNNSFAMELGGGLDIPVNRIVSIRPVEVDYLFTKFSANNISATQNNFRYFGGIDLYPWRQTPNSTDRELLCCSNRDWSGDPVTANDQHAELQSQTYGYLQLELQRR